VAAPPKSPSENSATLPLSGLKVVEFTQLIMGPTVGMILADLGADVIKIEPVDGGDPTRKLKGFPAGFFPYFNRNKRSIAVDLKAAEGAALVRRLIEDVDIAIENFAPSTMERLGCDGPTLCGINPRLIYCSLKGFLDGPYAHRSALDEVIQFMGGLAYMTGPAGRPLRAGTSVVDLMGATMAVIGILAAMRERDRTGRGTIVKSSLFESTVFMMGQHMAGAVVTGEKLQPMPEKRGGWSIYEPFKTADGEQVFIALTSNKHWVNFCESFGLKDLKNDSRLETNEQRVAARPWMLPHIVEAVGKLPKSEVLTLCDRANVPFAPVAHVEDLFDDPHLNQSGALLDIEVSAGKNAKLPRLPIAMQGHSLNLAQRAPHVGEHSYAILKGMGLSPDQIAKLVDEGIVAAPR
jgi:crotonobetainyl-CoA:carnitine CoA-transferase CaiB-like acyl-CoA transferase